MRISLERLLVSKSAFALPASPLQRAICRVADGLPLGDLATHPHVISAFGGESAVAALPLSLPLELYLLAGIRSGKSLMAACLALRAALTCDLSRLRPGEIPRVSVVSIHTDLAHVVYSHLRGTIEAQPALRKLLVCDPTADLITLRHPSRRTVEIKVVAGSRAGSSLVARWSAGAIFDEFPRMFGEREAVVNFDQARKAVIGRLVPGAQLVAIGSPWAPSGPAHRVVTDHFGRPTRDLVVVRGTGPQMNPAEWTPERCAALRRQDIAAYRTDVECEFADEYAGLFASGTLNRCIRELPLERAPADRQHYVAAIDPATRSDSWTLLVLSRNEEQRIEVTLARRWRPEGQTLSPARVLREIAGILRPYRTHVVHTDSWSADAIRSLGLNHGLYLQDTRMNAARRVEAFDALRVLVTEQQIEFPAHDDLLDDLRAVRRVSGPSGPRIELPRVGGSHCDYASALALALTQPLPPPDGAPDPDTEWQRRFSGGEDAVNNEDDWILDRDWVTE